MRRLQSGFTIMELLVVIGIIFILMALFMPLANKARENARMANCMSNQRQIMAAIHAFAADNDEQCPGAAGGPYPLGGIPNAGPGNIPFITLGQVISCYDSLPQNVLEQTARSTLVLRGYLPNTGVFHCPERDVTPFISGAPRSTVIYHYVFNEYLCGTMRCDQVTGLPFWDPVFTSVYNGSLPLRLSRCKNPSGCVMITEDAEVDGPRVVEYDRVTTPPTVNGVQPLDRIHATPVHIYRGHLRTDDYPNVQFNNAICTYVDGHSESLPVSTVALSTDPNAFTVPTDGAGLH